MISTMARKHYTDDFRRQAVNLYESTEGATLSGIAGDRGIARVGTGATTAGPRVQWSYSNQLQTNIVTLPALGHLAVHVEAQLDVTLAVPIGSSTLRHGRDEQGVTAAVRAPAVLVLPAGTRRSFRAGPDGVTYLTSHRRRAGLLPQTR